MGDITRAQAVVADLKYAAGTQDGNQGIRLPVTQLMAFVVVSLLGLLALVSGLLWDAALHAADRTLAATEGPFTLHNPGHLLFAGGVFLTSAGLAGLVTAVIRAVVGRPRGRAAATAAGITAKPGQR